MNKIFRGISVKLLRSQATRNFILDREIAYWNAFRVKCMLVTSRRVQFQNADFRWFSGSPSLSEQSSTGVKDDVGNRSQEENAEKYDELDSKIAQYMELAQDVEKKKKILMILMEHEVAKLEGRRVPSKINVEEMRDILNLHSFSSRVKYLSFLHVKEQAKLAGRRRKEIKRKEYENWLNVEKPNIPPPEHVAYGIGNNTLLVRVRRKSVMRFYNQRLANAALHEQKLIIDMDYDSFMRRQDSNNCAEQLLEMYSANRRNSSPFDLIFCNAHHDHPTMRAVRRFMPNLYAPDNFITSTDLSYLDIFPKEQLIYITPYAREPMQTYDHNAIYILGGLVDKVIKEPVVMAKAKREGLKAVHLPYEDYVMWGRGSKSLPINQIVKILLEMKQTGDWNKAFKHVPKRKLVRSLDLFSEF